MLQIPTHTEILRSHSLPLRHDDPLKFQFGDVVLRTHRAACRLTEHHHGFYQYRGTSLTGFPRAAHLRNLVGAQDGSDPTIPPVTHTHTLARTYR